MPNSPSRKTPAKKAKRSQPKKASAPKRKVAGTNAVAESKEALNSFKGDLAILREDSSRRQLETLSTVDTTDFRKVRNLYHSFHPEAIRALTYVVSIDEEKFQMLLSQLGRDGEGLQEIRRKFLTLSPTLLWLRRESRGALNTWDSVRGTPFFNALTRYPMIDSRLFDSIGNELLHSRQDVDDFAALAQGILHASLEATESVVRQEIEVSTDFVTDVRSTIKHIAQICQDFEKILDRTKTQKTEADS